MQLSIVGCPDKERFRPYVKRAVIFYTNELISKKLLENIYLKIKFSKTLDVLGYAEVKEYNNSGKPREFEIELNYNVSGPDILKTLAHELVHIKQFVYGETNEALTRWKGNKVSNDTDYWFEPWEIEARGLEIALFTKFVISEKLWNVFNDIYNLDEPIEKEPIGWKEYS
jgi:hypothetical protein